MTINTESTKRIYDGNGTTTDFDYDFKIFVDTDLLVTLIDAAGNETVQVLNTDYTVTGEGFEAGGKVKFTSAPAAGVTVLIQSDVPYTQPTDFKNQGRFFPETHENALDRAARQVLQVSEKVGRALTLPAYVTGASTDLPTPDPAKVIGWAQDGKSLANYSIADLGTTLAFSNFIPDVFTATPGQTDFTLSANPGVLGNLDVSIDGVVQVPTADYTLSGTTLTFVTPMVGGEIVLARYGAALPVGAGDAAQITFTAAGSGAVQRTVQSKERDWISVKDFGATGDGSTDDTVAVHNTINYAKSIGAAVYFPAGTYRVTSGYTQSTAYRDVRLFGAGRNNENIGISPQRGSCILLDSSDTASFFFRQAARMRLQVENMIFRCAQFVQDRSFFEFTGGGASHYFESLNFESVEKPIVYKEGCYFQSASISNVQFRASGTIHSSVGGVGETNSLRGTLLVLDNVNHEGSVPANSEKVICNLTGIRDIQGRNFLLEGASPGSDWKVLKLYNPYDADYIRRPLATFNGFHSEWSGTKPATCIEQTGGNVIFNNPGALISIDSKYSLKSQATATVNGCSFSSNTNPLSDYFVFEDSRCKVSLNNCSSRGLGSLLLPRNITLTNCSANSSTEALVATPIVSNDMARLVWKFDGGFVQSPATVYQGGGTTSYPSSDASYGRKLVIVPSADNFQYILKLPFTNLVTTEDSISIVLKVKLPTYTGGTVAISLTSDNTAVSNLVSFSSAYSGQIIDTARCVSLAAISGSTFGVQLRLTSGAGVVGNAEVICFEIYAGAKIPKVIYPSYPNNIVTYASAAPTLGDWKRGDIVYNSAPSAGGKAGWVCTTAGTPGTWKAFGVIDA